MPGQQKYIRNGMLQDVPLKMYKNGVTAMRGRRIRQQKNGRLIYVLPKNQDNNAQVKIAKKALEDFVLDVEPVSNQVVVKTTTAAAQVIAESIDNLYIDNIVASIAGDNVVLIISTDESKAREVAKSIEDNIK